MERQPTQLEGFEYKLESLSKVLISGGIHPDVFLDKVLELDQSDPERKSSVPAAEILQRPEVVQVFESIDEREKFYSIRSLTLFHRAQVRLSKGETDVKDDLQIALQDSEAIAPQNESWANYIRATIAYLDNDLDSLRTYAGQSGMNNSLVNNFVGGLEERGYPAYLTDYSKERE